MAFGDGVQEIYNGKLSIHFADPAQFAKTSYAKSKENHPILLAMRYLRNQALNYYYTYGDARPTPENILRGADSKSIEAVKKQISGAKMDPSLQECLKKDRFRSWFNGSLQKAFRSYNNPTATHEIMKAYGVEKLISEFAELDGFNQYLFRRYYNPTAVEAALKSYDVDSSKFFTPVGELFPDGLLYHGTRTDEGFRNIVTQGVFRSESGSAGSGLYGVDRNNIGVAEEFAGSRKERLIQFPVSKDARVVDITHGEGKRVWDLFLKTMGSSHDLFANAFGIDILGYPYGGRAFVVKNSAVLSKGQGVHVKLYTFFQALEKVRNSSDIKDFEEVTRLNSFSSEQIRLLTQSMKISPSSVIQRFRERGSSMDTITIDFMRADPENYEEIFREIVNSKKNDAGWSQRPLFEHVLSHPHWNQHEDSIIRLFREKAIHEEQLKAALPNAAWADRPKVFWEIWDYKNLYGARRWNLYRPILMEALLAWPARPELMKKIIEKGENVPELIRKVLADHAEYAEHPQLIDQILATGKFDDDLIEGLFSQKLWSAHPRKQEWLKVLLSRPESHRALLTHFPFDPK